MKRKPAGPATERKCSDISGCPGSSKRDDGRIADAPNTLALVPPEHAQVFVDLSTEPQLRQMPQQSLRAHFVSGVSIVVECRADMVIHDIGVEKIRCDNSVEVIENEWARRNQLDRN